MAGLEGRTLDRYELQQLIGRGGMADVYLGHDPHFGREVAVKVFKREDEDLLRRFVREAHMMASLRHPHLIPVYDSGSSPLDGVNLFYIVMPVMSGGSLRELVRNSPLSLQAACRYITDIASALDYIHRQGIIHRDIKSSNVLLDEEGNCYLSDFGIARAMADSNQMTSTGNVLGTVDYMAPELFETNQKANPSSDLYSLGVLLFEMVTGTLPFTAESQIAVVAMHVSKRPPPPRSIVPTTPIAVEQVIFRSLEKRAEFRYGSATALAQAFCQATTMRQIDVPHATNPLWGQSVNPALPAEMWQNAQPVASPSSMARSNPTLQTTRNYTSDNLPSYAPGVYGQQGYQAQPSGFQRVPTSPARKQARIVTILALIALLAILGPVGYIVIAHPSLGNTGQTTSTITVTSGPDLAGTAQAVGGTATQQAQAAQASATATAVTAAGAAATAQAQATATQQAKNNATATAVAGASATAVANVAATAGVIQTATATQPVLTDPLNNKDNEVSQAAKWDQNDNCVFQNDGYHVMAKTGTLTAGTLVGCRETSKNYQNFTATVDVVINSGRSGGLFFRVKPTTPALGAYSGYLFEIDSNGKYRIAQSGNFNAGDTALQNWTASAALKTGNAVSNTLQVIAHDGTLLFYINGVFVAAPAQDKTYVRAANIGFLARIDANNPAADVVYSNLNVYP